MGTKSDKLWLVILLVVCICVIILWVLGMLQILGITNIFPDFQATFWAGILWGIVIIPLLCILYIIIHSLINARKSKIL